MHLIMVTCRRRNYMLLCRYYRLFFQYFSLLNQIRVDKKANFLGVYIQFLCKSQENLPKLPLHHKNSLGLVVHIDKFPIIDRIWGA